MHHSRLSTIMIDCLDETFAESLEFWSGALGLQPRRRPAPGDRYVTLGDIPGPVSIRLQRVTRDPGFHLDLESDDLAAERVRLEAAGGRTKYRIKRWWVMEDPSGNPFCVIRPESDGFPENANQWRCDHDDPA